MRDRINSSAIMSSAIEPTFTNVILATKRPLDFLEPSDATNLALTSKLMIHAIWNIRINNNENQKFIAVFPGYVEAVRMIKGDLMKK